MNLTVGRLLLKMVILSIKWNLVVARVGEKGRTSRHMALNPV